ncbi:aminoacyl-histidine dipeptidase [[Clostridium] hylemonae]|uniref:aminoacyl-histidine dipeptidase n=1 Tax=[Clostridium] hylemonae TaxID=89153 RepID=UPI001D077506|nr:aminoacyl-histidine dipeptidase [[Clostridium] hylemonae]MCB7521286.1 aminoacyl-histidine dipeptidase [[Clostridium] hylemonae]
MAVLDQLEPKKVFQFFEELCQIPHGTFDTKRISDHCVAFARERGLEAAQDDANNVIIRKPGTKGYENSEPVILQGHVDMVCEKKPGSSHDFSREGLELYIEDGYVKAKDTTLGGDDGIAVAMIMALLDSNDIPHPPIEAVFTTDEEVGMGGAMAIDLSVLKGRKLINIDSEEEGILTTGCAGGFRYETLIPVHRERKTGTVVTLKIHGLQGGHSGIEIHKQRGNAHKMMGRLLNHIGKSVEISLAEINGGSKDNVIAMESTAEILVADKDAAAVKAMADEMKAVWDNEFMGDEPGLAVEADTSADSTVDVCDKAGTERVISYLVTCPYGVQGYSRKLKGLVETSMNIGILETAADHVKTVYLARSSVESKKQEMKEVLAACAKTAGGEGQCYNEYPAWQFNPESELRQIMEDVYEDMFGKKPEVTTVHAGLECGLFLGKKPELDCVSFGPDIMDVHSFNERLGIESTARSWKYLQAVLAKCK